jgi:steroid delta-isomerase-like uncharacterized protein
VGQLTRAAVERYLAALNAGDADTIAACVTGDFHNEHTSAGGHSLRGRDAYRNRLAGFLAEFRELRYDVEDILVDGDRAAVGYRMSFRTAGASGEDVPVTVRGVFRFQVVDGLIAHRLDYWDGTTVARQLGR